MDRKIKLPSRSAKDALSRMKKIGIKTENTNTRILVEILSEKRWTAYELTKILSERKDYDCNGFSGDKLANLTWDRLFYFKQRYPSEVFDIFYKEWFVIGSVADPKFDPYPSMRRQKFGKIYKNGQKRHEGERSLRDLIFEILKKFGPLEQRDLVFEVKSHPDYFGMHTNHLALRKAIAGTLRNCSRKEGYCRLFRKSSGNRPTKWQAIEGADTPPIRRKPKTENLAQLMSLRRVWTTNQLTEIAFGLNHGHSFSDSSESYFQREYVRRLLNNSMNTRFERIRRGSRFLWKLKPNSIARISLQERLKALDLLFNGMKVTQIIERLCQQYPRLDWATVKRMYDPRGIFSISQYEGASGQIIAQAKNRMTLYYDKLVSHMRGVGQNMEFKEKWLRTRAKKTFSRDVDADQYLEESDINLFEGRNGWITPGNIKNPESSLLLKERNDLIADALESLEPEEQLVVRLVFYENRPPEKMTDNEKRLFREDARLILQRALSKLAHNKLLREIG